MAIEKKSVYRYYAPMSDILNKEAAWLLSEKYNGIESEAYQKDLLRLKSGEPLAYIIGHTPFLNATIHLESRPLIPRSETEHWVSQALKEIKKDAAVLDLCAGSGCIGVAVSMECGAHVDFGEIDERYHATIEKNIRENVGDVSHTMYGGDVFENIEKKYNFILTNPPYINPALEERVEASVRLHEPERALFGGKNGMDIIEKIIKDAPSHLLPDGIIYIEHEPEQVDALNAIAHEAGFRDVVTRKDQYGIDRYTRIGSYKD